MVRYALSSLLSPTGAITEKLPQEVLRRVFGPATAFDKPILNFAMPGLARLVKYGLQSVVWETPECGKGQARCVLKPIDGEDQEPLFEFLGKSLYKFNICRSLY